MIKCESCGKSYDSSKSDTCPKCGAFNSTKTKISLRNTSIDSKTANQEKLKTIAKGVLRLLVFTLAILGIVWNKGGKIVYKMYRNGSFENKSAVVQKSEIPESNVIEEPSNEQIKQQTEAQTSEQPVEEETKQLRTVEWGDYFYLGKYYTVLYQPIIIPAKDIGITSEMAGMSIDETTQVVLIGYTIDKKAEKNEKEVVGIVLATMDDDGTSKTYPEKFNEGLKKQIEKECGKHIQKMQRATLNQRINSLTRGYSLFIVDGNVNCDELWVDVGLLKVAELEDGKLDMENMEHVIVNPPEV